MKLVAYPAYKPSGVEWLGEIPKFWGVKRLKFASQINPPKSELHGFEPTAEVSFLPMEKIGEDGSLSLDEKRALEEVGQGYTYFRESDVIVAKITPCFENGKGALCKGLSSGIGFGTTELHVLRQNVESHAGFLFYLTRTHPFRKLGIASMYGAAGQQRVPDSFVKDFRAGLPPLSEQRAIASFLDRETTKIDALIAKKQRLIELLQEKRTALISHAVTKGLDPNVSFKDSGAAWPTAIPAHWETKPLGAVARLQRGHDLTVQERNEGNIPVISSSGMSGFHDSAKAKGPGVVTGRYGTIGEIYYVEQDYWPMNTALYVCNFNGNYPRYIYYLLKLLPFDAYSGKSAVPGIDRNDLHRVAVVSPPEQEQRAIAAYLDRETAKIDALIAKVQQAIETLKEYRTALISAAVTGKIDVRVIPVGAQHSRYAN